MNDRKLDIYAKAQLMLANASVGALAVIAFFILLNIKTTLDWAMFSASLITFFYFWWGYIFFIKVDMHSKKIDEFFLDFILLIMLVGLFYITVSSSKDKAVIWILDYLVLFLLTLVKYMTFFFKTKDQRKIFFTISKLKVDGLAVLVIGSALFVASVFDMGLVAIWMIFFMELTHILFVSFFDRFYEKF